MAVKKKSQMVLKGQILASLLKQKVVNSRYCRHCCYCLANPSGDSQRDGWEPMESGDGPPGARRSP